MIHSRLLPPLPRPTRKQTFALLGLAVASLVVGFVFHEIAGPILPGDPRELRAWLRATGPIAPFVYMALMILAIVVAPIPSIPLDLAAGLTFGIVWGTVYTLIGAEIGGLIAFAIARRFGRPWLVRHLSRRAMTAIDTIAARLGGFGLALTRFLPVFDFDWVSYAAGLTPMSTGVYALATFIGMIPPVIGIVAVGNFLFTDVTAAALIFGTLFLLYILPVIGWLIWPADVASR